MAVHYEVAEGKTLVITGPANVIVKCGDYPDITDVVPADPDSKKRKTHAEPHQTKNVQAAAQKDS